MRCDELAYYDPLKQKKADKEKKKSNSKEDKSASSSSSNKNKKEMTLSPTEQRYYDDAPEGNKEHAMQDIRDASATGPR